MSTLGYYKALQPVRSVLFSLAPIGLGTQMCESLESYVCRLAKHHQVSRRSVEQTVNRHGETLYNDVSGPPRLDSPTQPAQIFAKRLAELTMRPSVVRLGLAPLSGLISTMNTLRNQRAWCGDCFCETRDAGTAAHLPLAWSLSCYQRCHIHQQVLDKQCSRCGKQSICSNSWNRAIDHCPWCNKDLAVRRQSRPSSFAQIARRHDVEADMFCSEMVAELVAHLSSATEAPTVCNVHNAIRAAIERGLCANVAEFGRKGSLPKATLHCAANGRNRPSLAVSLRIAAAAQVPIAALYFPTLSSDAHQRPLLTVARSLGKVREAKRHAVNWSVVSSQARSSLRQGERVTLRQLASDLDVDASMFASRIGEVRHEILRHAKKERSAQREVKIQALADSVREVRLSLKARGVRVSARRIGVEMGRHERTLCMREAIRLSQD